MVTGGMDLLLSGEFGNSAFCTIKQPPLKPGTILLEAMFVVSCIAPGDLQLHRFLPLTTIRRVVDNRSNDLTEILSGAHLNRLAQKVSIHHAHELVRQTRPRITTMLEYAVNQAEAQKGVILEAAISAMKSAQQVEWDRLRALAEVNPNIRPEEIRHVEGLAEQLESHLAGAQLRLDAIRVAMVAE